MQTGDSTGRKKQTFRVSTIKRYLERKNHLIWKLISQFALCTKEGSNEREESISNVKGRLDH